MNIMKKNFAFASLLLIIIAVGGSYFRSFTECKIKIGKRIEEAFQKKAPLWGDCILHSKGILYIGNYDSREYANKKMTTMITGGDTIEISNSFYHPDSYNEYQLKNLETHLLTHDEFDVYFADSLFKTLIAELGFIAESSIELKVRNLAQMFPSADSMYVDAPFVKILSSRSVDGYTTEPVGVGICDHALLYGHVKLPFSVIFSDMEWFGVPQIVAIMLLVLLYFILYIVIPRFLLYLKFRKNVVFLGNTCIDLSRKELYLWSGECRHISDIKFKLVEMIVESAPTYQLSKAEVCRTIWNRNVKDGQALYNVAMADMRTLFITEDPALELKSMPREGMQLLINSSLIKTGRSFRFLWLYLGVTSKRVQYE